MPGVCYGHAEVCPQIVGLGVSILTASLEGLLGFMLWNHNHGGMRNDTCGKIEQNADAFQGPSPPPECKVPVPFKHTSL